MGKKKKIELPTLRVDDDFKELITPLSDNEINKLIDSILENGCMEPIKTWNGAIIDGHNRYLICHEYNIPFAVQELNFASKEQAMIWMVNNQLARRNLTTYNRALLGIKIAELQKSQAAENSLKNLKNLQGLCDKESSNHAGLSECQNSDTRDKEIFEYIGRVDEYAAKFVGVSRDTIHKVRFVEQNASNKVRFELLNREISINKAYTETVKFVKKNMLAETIKLPDNSKFNVIMLSLMNYPSNIPFTQKAITTIIDAMPFTKKGGFLYILSDNKHVQTVFYAIEKLQQKIKYFKTIVTGKFETEENKDKVVNFCIVFTKGNPPVPIAVPTIVRKRELFETIRSIHANAKCLEYFPEEQLQENHGGWFRFDHKNKNFVKP